MLHIDVGLSAIRASQQALYAISNNIANANTEGYHRQRVELIDRNPITIGSLQIGTGVEVESLTRLRDTATEGALISTNSAQSQSETTLRILGQLEAALLPTQGSLIDSVSNFFNEIEQLAAQPSTVTIRDAVLASANAVVQQINHLDSRLNELRTTHAIEIAEQVAAVNQETAQIAQLNRDIRIASHSGTDPNSLLDQRDRLVSQLSNRIDISLQTYLVPGSPLVAANGAIIIAEEATQLTSTTSPNGRAAIETSQSQREVQPTSGILAGLLAGQQLLDSLQSDLHAWTTEFVRGIDQLQTTGLGQNQQKVFLQGTRPVSDATIPLAEVNLPFQIESGSLFVTLTDLSTSTRKTERIDLDVGSDSLNDLLVQLNTIPNLQADHQQTSQQVTFRTSPGFSVDFAGGIDPNPRTSNLTGTSSAMLTGFPLNEENRQWTATVLGTGDVGLSDGLQIEVTDEVTGESLKTVSIGAGYLPGEKISLGNGIELTFTSGTVTAGESISFDLVAAPDETGLLVALGLNTLFAGNTNTGFTLNPHVSQSPLSFAASRTGASADASNLSRFIKFRESSVFLDRNETVEERLASLSTATAFRIQSEEANQEYLTSQQNHLANVRDSVSGVDPNEELLNMLEFQRQFQAASRFVTVVDEALDELMRLIS